MKTGAILAAAAILGLASTAAVADGARIYKWFDDDGIVNYGALPPEWSEAESTGINTQRTDAQDVGARANANAARADAMSIRKKQEADSAQQEKLSRQDIANQRVQNCQNARERLKTYSEAQRLYRPTEDGEREYLSDDELDKARADAISLVNEWCDDA